jgi:hypothetical protein
MLSHISHSALILGFVTPCDAKAVWVDTEIGLQHLNAWKRVTVVSDVSWIRTRMKTFRFIIPEHVRVFT